MKVTDGPITLTATTALAPYLRVKLSSSKLVAAGAGELGLGTLCQRVLAADDPGAVLTWQAEGTRKMVAAGAITQFATVYPAAGGKISATVAGKPLGIALEAASGDGSIIEVYPTPGLGELADVSFSIGAESTNAIVVSLQAKDAQGNDVTKRVPLTVYLLADANGDAFNSEDYTIAAGTDGALVELAADKVLECITEDDGDLDISLTIAGAATTYLGVKLPGRNDLIISDAITHAA